MFLSHDAECNLSTYILTTISRSRVNQGYLQRVPQRAERRENSVKIELSLLFLAVLWSLEKDNEKNRI